MPGVSIASGCAEVVALRQRHRQARSRDALWNPNPLPRPSGPVSCTPSRRHQALRSSDFVARGALLWGAPCPSLFISLFLVVCAIVEPPIIM